MRCSYTGIKTLNVSTNTKLTYLNCNYTEITELDVRNNTELETLFCSDTGITELNVSNNTALTLLACNSTKITELNVSQNTKLETLSCSKTGITELDVRNNTALKRLHCESTGIKTLVVTNNTALLSLSCGSTGILSLDLSNNPLLYDVDLSSSSRSVAITSDRVSLQSIDPNLDGTRISNLQNATLSADKQFFENYVFGTPITYDYDCGNPTSVITMYVTLTLTQKNENIWITPLKIENWTYGDEAKQPVASAKYGTPNYLYSDNKDGTYTEVVPTRVGTWYVKANVEEGTTYTGLESEVTFTISPKQLTDKSITSTDVKSESDELVIKDGATTLVLDRDYTVQTQETNGTVTLTITGIGNYQGTIVKSYTKNSSIPPVDDKDTPTNDKQPTSPQTGDTLNIMPYIGFIALSAIVVCVVRKKKTIKE